MEKDYLSNIQLYRKNSDRLAKKLLPTKIKPNQITIFGILCSVLSAYFFYMSDYIMLIIAMIFLNLSYFSDHLDGSLARLRKTTSNYGRWLDDVGGIYGWLLIFMGITAGVYNQIPKPYILILGALAIIPIPLKHAVGSYFVAMFDFAQDFRTDTYQKWKKFLMFRYNHKFLVPLLSIGAIFNKMYWVLLICGIYGPLYISLQTAVMTLKAHKYDKQEQKKKKEEQEEKD